MNKWVEEHGDWIMMPLATTIWVLLAIFYPNPLFWFGALFMSFFFIFWIVSKF